MSEARVLLGALWLKSGPAARVLQLLNSNGEEARVVGGAVRNALLKIPTGDIDIAGRNFQQRIADRTADYARFLAIAVQQLKHAGGRTGFEPERAQEHARLAHFSTPGLNLPVSTWAGTYGEV